MTSDRKQPGVAFWATVVVVAALVGYPLSFGPFLWLFMHGILPVWIAAIPIYSPLQWLRDHGPCTFSAWLDWYIQLWR